MRLSGFNLYVEDYPDESSTLVHNTFSGAYVVLGKEDVELLRRADRGDALTDDERAAVADPELWDPDVGICVESRAAEEKEFRRWFEARRSEREISVILGINLACNFDCPYCSQATVMSGKVMSEETCDATADWLVSRAHEIDATSLSIAFVGGEPLLHPGRIKRICSRVRANLRAQTRFSFQLITNAYFLDDAMVTDLLPYGLVGAKVTLDGDETTHDITRVSRKKERTFERLFANIVNASKRIGISVNGNHQENTVHGFAPLIEKLAAAGLAEGSRVAFSPALEALSTDSGVGSGSCTFSNSDMRHQTTFYDMALANGFDPGDHLHAVGPCSYHDRHGYAIDPNGVLLKCPGFLGHAEWGIGDVVSGLNSRYDQLVNINPQRECGGCAHRPNCAGGCVAAQWVELGHPEGVNCEVSYFDETAPSSVVRAYLLASEETTEDALARFPPSPPPPAAPEAPAPTAPSRVHLKVV